MVLVHRAVRVLHHQAIYQRKPKIIQKKFFLLDQLDSVKHCKTLTFRPNLHSRVWKNDRTDPENLVRLRCLWCLSHLLYPASPTLKVPVSLFADFWLKVLVDFKVSKEKVLHLPPVLKILEVLEPLRLHQCPVSRLNQSDPMACSMSNRLARCQISEESKVLWRLQDLTQARRSHQAYRLAGRGQDLHDRLKTKIQMLI